MGRVAADPGTPQPFQENPLCQRSVLSIRRPGSPGFFRCCEFICGLTGPAVALSVDGVIPAILMLGAGQENGGKSTQTRHFILGTAMPVNGSDGLQTARYFYMITVGNQPPSLIIILNKG